MRISSMIGVSLALAALSAVPAVRAEALLHLQVGGESGVAYDDEYSGRGGESAYFDYVTVKTDGGAQLDVYNGAVNTRFNELYANEDRLTTEAAYFGAFEKDAVGYFTVELWNESGSRVGWQRYAMGSLSDYIWKPGDTAGASTLVVDSVIPEPSSGLLLLVGGVLLALRRRRA